MIMCECEHVKHFEGDGHKYSECEAEVAVKTEYGWFKVCRKCASTCLKGFILGIEEEI